MRSTSSSPATRRRLEGVRRIVIKVGTKVLVDSRGRPLQSRLKALVADIAALHRQGRQVVLVTSGAIGSGMQVLGLNKRPKDLPSLQMAAAVGQSRLMAQYDALFARMKCVAGQVLLTHEDFKNRERHLNSRNTLNQLLSRGVIPVINENDAVSCEEIKFGDNDILAALVTLLIDAELLIMLSATDGFRKIGASGRGRRIPELGSLNPETLALVRDEEQELSRGGMKSKLISAGTALKGGAAVVIADGRKSGVIRRIVAGADEGTLIFNGQNAGKLSARKRWIAFFSKAKGAIKIDGGAEKAVCRLGKSLLPAGISGFQGAFQRGEMVDIVNPEGKLVARGLVEYSSEEIEQIGGKPSSMVEQILGHAGSEEAVHRDNLVVL